MLYCFRYALIAVWVESKCFCSRWAAYNSLKLCPYRLVVRTPGSHPGNRSSILREGTNTELNGFFKAKRWDARSASHWFPPIFPNEFRIFGALARTCFSPRRRFEIRSNFDCICFAQNTKTIFITMMNNMENKKFFLYARKSTDVKDKQVLSIEAQLTELRDYAKRENLNIALEFVEKQSAKYIGRPIFNEMMKCIEKGDADSILSWHPERLARNSIDGGKIIYLLDTGKLARLKFPTFWCDSTSQGKFMLNMAFGQSKYYVDSLSENTKRGLRQKVRNGDYPTLAPVGYINDSRTKTVVVDRKKAKIIKQAFEFYVKGGNRLE